MSWYGVKWKIDGVPTGHIKRVGTKAYEVRFEREYASIEDIEGIHWDEPQIETIGAEECPLPAGGFSAANPTYDGSKRAYSVLVQLQRTYYGDVRAYEEELEHKREIIDERNATIQTLTGELDEAKVEVAAKSKTIEQQADAIGKKDKEIAALNADLEEADATVMDLYEQINGGADNE